MKKCILAAAVLALAPFAGVFAQQGFHVGLTTGYYRTLILDKGLFDAPTYEHQSSYRAAPIGLALGYQWDSGNGIQLEIIKAKIGQEFDIRHIASPGAAYTTVGQKEIELDYLQVPLLFKLQSGENKARFSFMFGPQVSFLQEAYDIETFDQSPVRYEGNTSVTVVPGREYTIGSTETDAIYNFNSVAIGGVLGLGLDYYITDGLYVSGNLRLGYNFTEMREEEGGTKHVDTPANTTSNQPTTANRLYAKELRTAAFGGLQVGVHYLFGQ